jgi:hypothetical protein
MVLLPGGTGGGARTFLTMGVYSLGRHRVDDQAQTLFSRVDSELVQLREDFAKLAVTGNKKDDK